MFVVCWLRGKGGLMSAREACFMVGYRGESRLMSAVEASDSAAEWLTFKA